MTTTADPIMDLMNDHRLIEAVLDGLEKRLRADGPFPAEFLERALSFFVEYADQFHHFKEEESLFPAMVARGMSAESGPIGVMLQEHTFGRRMLAGIREELPAARAGDEKAQASIRAYATQYAEMLRNHIWKEDNILFRMAQQTLDDEATAELMVRFARGSAEEKVARHRAFALAARG